MSATMNLIWKLRIWKDTQGQEMIEYALLAAFLACACGAALPDVGLSVVNVFSKILSVFSPIDDGAGGGSHNS